MKDSLPTRQPYNPQSKTKTQVETSSRVLSSQLLSMAVKAQPASLADSPRFVSWPRCCHSRPRGERWGPHRLKTQDCGPTWGEVCSGEGRAVGGSRGQGPFRCCSLGQLWQPVFPGGLSASPSVCLGLRGSFHFLCCSPYFLFSS